jgi:predicted PurR-regulated permease PerM
MPSSWLSCCLPFSRPRGAEAADSPGSTPLPAFRAAPAGKLPDVSRVLWPATRIAVNLILIAVAVIGGLWVLGELRVVVIPVLASLLVATLLVPPTDFLRRRGWPSALATGVVMVVAAAILGGVIALIAPAFVDQLGELESSVDEAVEEVVRWLVQGPFDLERSQIDEAVQSGLDSLRSNAGGIGRGVLSGASILAEVIAGLLLMIVLVFFFVHDGRRMWEFGLSLVPGRRRELVDGAGHEVWSATSGYMRGVALIAVVDAVLIGIALAVIGVPLVLPLMVLVFLGAFIPLVGAVVSGAVAALVALISNGVVDAALVVAAVVAIQQIEGDLLYPNVVGKMIRLHPVAILVVLTAGTVVAGIFGALLSIPIAAAAWTAFRYARERLDEGVAPPR